MLHLTTSAWAERASAEGTPRTALGRALWRRGVASAHKLAEIEARAAGQSSSLADAFRLGLFVPSHAITEAEAEIAGFGHIDPFRHPPDGRLLGRISAPYALRHGILPWRRIGGQTVILISDVAKVAQHQAMLEETYGPLRFALTSASDLQAMLTKLAARDLCQTAETLTPALQSCRNWDAPRARRLGLAFVLGVAALAIATPQILLGLVYGWAVLTLVAHMALKLAATLTLRRAAPHDGPVPADPVPLRKPVVTLLVPLFREREIASHLIARLARIDYPRELLDVCLLLEQDDLTTQNALTETNLPRWMRAIIVPRGTLKTKPRALNYGLGFARGSIIGVYDAEDAPAPDQINAVVNRFATRPPEVACLQGVLDFYNSETNWLARCFTIEYAAWFRIMLPGLQRLGLVIPLGGTTLFFRREILEKLGGWDAHNVTEDADLGIRLARRGYRTELIETVTEEEVNCRTWPWVKQRSRWLKGYAITYAVHMRRPRALWADLGAWRFFGIQLQFLGTLSQFALAPLLWSFWLLPLGYGHPLQAVLPGWAFVMLGVIFLASEVLNITVSAIAAIRAGKPGLIKWAPTLHLYFPLAALAAYKGLAELFWKPFYWDKTAHGIFTPATGRAKR